MRNPNNVEVMSKLAAFIIEHRGASIAAEEVLSPLFRVGADGIQIGLNVRAILSVKTTFFTIVYKLYRETTKQ